MSIILEYVIFLAVGIWLFIGVYLLMGEIISLIYISKTNKEVGNFVRVDLLEHTRFGPFDFIWNPPYRHIRKDCLESELEQSKFYVKVLKKTIKGKNLSEDELMLLIEKGFLKLESAEKMRRHTYSAPLSRYASELESLVKDKRYLFEDVQRPDVDSSEDMPS